MRVSSAGKVISNKCAASNYMISNMDFVVLSLMALRKSVYTPM